MVFTKARFQAYSTHTVLVQKFYSILDTEYSVQFRDKFRFVALTILVELGLY